MWVKRQTDGELDDTRLTEGLTGEASVYKRRGTAKPEMGRPQIKWVFMPTVVRWIWNNGSTGPNVSGSSLTSVHLCTLAYHLIRFQVMPW